MPVYDLNDNVHACKTSKKTKVLQMNLQNFTNDKNCGILYIGDD